MKKLSLLLAMACCAIPSLAWAETIHVSRYGKPLIIIAVIIILAIFALWAIRTWTPEMAKIWATLPKILTFIVIAIAVIWIIIILAGMAGIHIT